MLGVPPLLVAPPVPGVPPLPGVPPVPKPLASMPGAPPVPPALPDENDMHEATRTPTDSATDSGAAERIVFIGNISRVR